ncbi:MAG TPA: serpin family protein [Gemmatales bacterium]|nr:serpin family protein [Gemmatales bacterium]
MYLPIRFLALLGILGCASCSMQAEEKEVDVTSLRGFAHDTNQFCFRLYQELRKEQGNLFFSPYSISTALAMTATGAEGSTQEQMTQILNIGKDVPRFTELHHNLLRSLTDTKDSYQLRIANALWAEQTYPFRDQFTQRLKQSFRAEARTMDFVHAAEESRKTINQWVETQTNNRIKDLLPPGTIKDRTRLVLTNAVYFQGTWAYPFEKSGTKPMDFTLSDGTKVKADMMSHHRTFFYAENEEVQLLELPYQGNRLTMTILLPKELDGLAKVEQMAGSSLEKLLPSRQRTLLQARIPKFKNTYTASLNQLLQAIGMQEAFIEGQANFSGMDGTRNLYISDVVHKAFVDVHEEGTEAAAAMGVAMDGASAPIDPPKPITFYADHPFLYFIRDNTTGCILFMGRLNDPR